MPLQAAPPPPGPPEPPAPVGPPSATTRLLPQPATTIREVADRTKAAIVVRMRPAYARLGDPAIPLPAVACLCWTHAKSEVVGGDVARRVHVGRQGANRLAGAARDAPGAERALPAHARAGRHHPGRARELRGVPRLLAQGERRSQGVAERRRDLALPRRGGEGRVLADAARGDVEARAVG